MAEARVAIMRVVVVTPERWLGDVVGDLRARGGSIQRIEPVGENLGRLAYVPGAELTRYPEDLDRLTGGQARYQITFSHYAYPGDDFEGGAGVREPRTPRPSPRAQAAMVHPPLD